MTLELTGKLFIKYVKVYTFVKHYASIYCAIGCKPHLKAYQDFAHIAISTVVNWFYLEKCNIQFHTSYDQCCK